MIADRNTLGDAASPYLRQHRDNPVWWHEWSRETLEHARSTGKPLFVSVGYATCHWCHVMASEAFSDQACADALNRSFVCIKVDREERPDIDQFLMQFLVATRGHGGWPLNAFLTPDGRPFLALTYIPVDGRASMPGFVGIIDRVLSFYADRGPELPTFDLWEASPPRETDDPTPVPGASEPFVHRLDNLVRRGDHDHGGFGMDAKFPPHSTLLYLLFGTRTYQHQGAARFLRHTLDTIARRGLHDHLQGGFFRYCVDRAWTVPHFEKMLYDQALLLWVYAVAARLFDDARYGAVARGVVRALDDTFLLPDGVYRSAHDADTNHVEGDTYLWTEDELRDIAGVDAERLFVLAPGGTVDGRHHLVRNQSDADPDRERAVLERLLEVRRRRPQPATDDKVVTAWNALTGVALVEAGRMLQDPSLLARARDLYQALRARNHAGDGWARSSLGTMRSPGRFLEDTAAVLLLETYLAEDAATEEDHRRMCRQIAETRRELDTFRDERGWVGARTSDFDPLPAESFDSPTPSPVALVEMGLQRAALLRRAAAARVPALERRHLPPHRL